MKIYAGIGSRETPEDVLEEMANIAKYLSGHGYTLRSGGANGADSVFEQNHSGPNEIYLPWKGFNGNSSVLYNLSTFPEALKFAEQFHPAWARLSPPAKKLMARNVFQILGQDLKTPCDFVVCWTKDGKASGGTGQALRIASFYGIPILNLKNATEVKDISDYAKYLADLYANPFVKKTSRTLKL